MKSTAVESIYSIDKVHRLCKTRNEKELDLLELKSTIKVVYNRDRERDDDVEKRL